MKSIFYLLIAYSFTVVSCKKNSCEDIVTDTSTYDTIQPNKYYPAYPGSWWEYNETETVNVDPNWQQFTLRESIKGDECRQTTLNTVYCPKIDDKFVVGNSMQWLFNDFLNHEHYLFKGDESNWRSYEEAGRRDIDYYCSTCEYLAKDREMEPIGNLEINGEMFSNVIFIKETFVAESPSYGGPTGEYYFLYYAENIGLIRSIKHVTSYVDGEQVVTIDTLDITAYHINH